MMRKLYCVIMMAAVMVPAMGCESCLPRLFRGDRAQQPQVVCAPVCGDSCGCDSCGSGCSSGGCSSGCGCGTPTMTTAPGATYAPTMPSQLPGPVPVQ